MKTKKQIVLEHLESLGASPKRSLGQNFLVADHVIDKIVDRARQSKSSQYIEVGPGLGALTDDLKEFAEEFSVVEMDTTFAQRWRSLGLKVVEGDALKLDWSTLNLSEACLVSNLPYQISSSLVVERSINPCGLNEMILMFQKEVAQRIAAPPKTKAYGLLTVMAQAAWDVKTVCDAGPAEFYPPPNVSSRVLHFVKNRKYSGNWDFFLKFLKAGFAHRRKYLLSNLNSVILGAGSSKVQVAEKLTELGYSDKARAEEVSVQHWIALIEFLSADMSS